MILVKSIGETLSKYKPFYEVRFYDPYTSFKDWILEGVVRIKVGVEVDERYLTRVDLTLKGLWIVWRWEQNE